MSLDYEKFYDEKYIKSPLGFSSEFPRQIRFLLRWAGFGSRQLKILDLGGGTGEYSLILQRLGHDVTLFELSSVAVDTAQRLGVRKVICGDFLTSPPVKNFDLVFVKGFSPLNTDDSAKFEAMLDRMDGMLSPNGVILYWGVSDLSGRWTSSGQFCWKADEIRQFFDDARLCPALRYQAWMPMWISTVIDAIIVKLKVLPRPVTLIAYRRARSLDRS